MLLAVAMSAAAAAPSVRLYPELNDPFANPAQQRAWTKPPRALTVSAAPPPPQPHSPGHPTHPALNWSDWQPNKPHWSAYRGGLSSSALDSYNESGLGDVVWPQWPVLVDHTPTGNTSLKAELEDMARRGLWLTDISNYVPGDPSECDPASYRHISGVCEYHLPRSVQDLLNETMGERFTGMDNGEQVSAHDMLRCRPDARMP